MPRITPRGTRSDAARPTMPFTWGSQLHTFIRMEGTMPAPDGSLEPEYESTVVWHPVKQRFVFLGVYHSGAGKVIAIRGNGFSSTIRKPEADAPDGPLEPYIRAATQARRKARIRRWW